MTTSPGDLADEDLSYLLTRLNRLFEQRDAWPYLGLQYRMGEVGKNRIEPRKLRRALAELANNRRPRRGKLRMPGPWEAVPGIFAAPDATLEEAYHVSVSALERTQPLAGLDHADILDGLRAVMEGATGTFVLGQNVGELRTARPGPVASGVAFSRTLDLTCRLRSVTLWLTHETEWLYPDDPSLWAFLGRCVHTNSQPLIVARHIHRATFALFRLLGARGVQYYSMLVPEEAYGELAERAKETGWLHLRPVEDLVDHRVIDQIHASVRYLETDPLSPDTREAIESAMEYGLATTGGAEALLSWARHTGMDAGRPWEVVIKQWNAWGTYCSRRTGLPKGGISEVLTKTSVGRTPDPPGVRTTEELTTGDGERWTFGRDTEVSRVPIRLK